MQGRALLGPKSPDLPEFRVSTDFVFTKIGVDKAMILLFTCASTRNIHLELTPYMNAPALIRCFKRFISRRGMVQMVISDNFRTFLSKELKVFLLEKRIEWNFILQKSPWWGGFYERLIRVVKDCLKKVLGRAKLNYEEMETLLCEVEGAINSRP